VEIAYVFASIVLLVLLISWGKVQPFLAFLVASSVAAILLGLPLDKVPGVLEKGIGNILGGLLGIVCIGAMFGKLVANSGAAQKIAMVLTRKAENTLVSVLHTGWSIWLRLWQALALLQPNAIRFASSLTTKTNPTKNDGVRQQSE